jgi:hypothetical protein
MDLQQWWEEHKPGIPFPGYEFLKENEWLGDEKLGQILYDEEQGYSIDSQNWSKPVDKETEGDSDQAFGSKEAVSVSPDDLADIKLAAEIMFAQSKGVLDKIDALCGGQATVVNGNTALEKGFF